MGDTVSGPNDLPPCNVGLRLLDEIRHVVRRLAYEFDVTQGSIVY